MESHQNVVSVQIPAKEQEAIIRQVQDLQKKLAPYLIALTPESRRKGLKMSDKSLPFVEKATELRSRTLPLRHPLCRSTN